MKDILNKKEEDKVILDVIGYLDNKGISARTMSKILRKSNTWISNLLRSYPLVKVDNNNDRTILIK